MAYFILRFTIYMQLIELDNFRFMRTTPIVTRTDKTRKFKSLKILNPGNLLERRVTKITICLITGNKAVAVTIDNNVTFNELTLNFCFRVNQEPRALVRFSKLM